MCDRHKKLLDHVCLQHATIICSQCAIEEHSQTPCDSKRLSDAGSQINTKMDAEMTELKRLKSISQAILDGRYHDSTLRVISETESFLDEFVDEMKKKLNQARLNIRPFSELSSQDRWKLKAVATKRAPNGKIQSTDADDEKSIVGELLEQLLEVRKQTGAAKKALELLPNFVEVDPNNEFLDILKFDAEPVIMSGSGICEEIGDHDGDTATISTFNHETVYLTETSEFNLDHSSHMVMFDDYYIASVGDSVQKRDRKRMSFRQALTIPGAGTLRMIGSTTEVAVLQAPAFITVLETYPSLAVLYRIHHDNPIIDIDYFETIKSEPDNTNEMPVFVTCYRRKEGIVVEYVDLVRPKKTKYPGNPPLYNKTSTNIVDSEDHKYWSRVQGVSSVSTLLGTSIIIGAKKGVTCVNKTGALLWTVDIFKSITGLMSFKGLIYVAVEHEKRIMVIGRHGHVMDENILPPDRVSPERMSAMSDILLVKALSHYKWIIFKQTFDRM